MAVMAYIAVKRRPGFLAQDDVLHPQLTVRETLVFCAMLRLPASTPAAAKTGAAEAVIAELGLGACADTMVGNGVSGGERKRVSIGQEMLADPSLLILDEPTSGLDSTAAVRLVATISALARKGRTVVMSVHQPSGRLYRSFDSLLLLAEGSCLYHGPRGDAMDYFASLGFAPGLHVNPTDFMVDLANGFAEEEYYSNSAAAEVGSTVVKQLLISSYNRVLAPKVKSAMNVADQAEAGGDISAYLPRLESFGSDDVDELLRTEAAEGRPVRVVVYDPLLPWARRVARRHGVPCAAFFTQACSVNLAYAHAWTGLATLPVGENTGDLPALPEGLKPRDFPTYLTEERNSFPVYAELALNQLQELTSADHVLVNSFYELQPEEAEYMESTWGAVSVGPTVPSAYLDNRVPDDAKYGLELHVPMAAACRAWLDARQERSVVYVSFGSLVTLTEAQTAELAEGLCGGAMPCFLWVVRASETAKLPESFAERAKTQGRGLVVQWSPQLEVLAHPAIGCFLTHCGWNSTTEALGAGVPMVAMPQWSDQTMNTKYIEDVWRVGVRVRANGEDEVITKEELERCIREVMEDDDGKYAQNAARWSRKAKSAMSQGGSSDRNIKEFLAKFRYVIDDRT